MKKGIIISLLIIIAVVVSVVYVTHRSVDQVQTEEEKSILAEVESTLNDSAVKREEPIEKKESITQREEREDTFIREEPRPQSPTESATTLSSQNENEPEREEEQKVRVIKTGEFNPNAAGSDDFHRGWGTTSIVYNDGKHYVIFGDDFRVTNGPDYKLYLVPEADVETHRAFSRVKSRSTRIADVEQFSGGQIFEIPSSVDIEDIEGVVIWCEAFSQYISTATFR